MKYILTALLMLAGCDYIGPAAGGFNQGLNQSYMMDSQMRQNTGQIIYPNQNNPYNPNTNQSYWQEQNARQQYFNSIQPKSLFAQ